MHVIMWEAELTIQASSIGELVLNDKEKMSGATKVITHPPSTSNRVKMFKRVI